jgi:hypothetical protein
MNVKWLSMLVVVSAFALAACQKYIVPVKISTGSIPDQTYVVTVHESNPLYYAVLFDIPGDGKDVSLFYTYFTKRVGLDTPTAYRETFERRIRGYRTLQIRDRDGTVRGYLMVSKLLAYQIYERPVGETTRIIVSIDDPNLGGDDAGHRMP